MQTFWKVYFWVFLILDLTLGTVLIISQWHNYNVGDWVEKGIGYAILFALYCFAYRKTFIKSIFWKIFFWTIIGYIALDIIYSSTSFRFFSQALMPKYDIQLDSLLPEWLSSAISIPCLLFSLPIYYALFALGYKKFSNKKEKEISANAPYSGLAVASFSLGLTGLLLGPLTTIPALITGICGLHDISKRSVKGITFAWIGIMIFAIQTYFLYTVILMVVYVFTLPGATGDFHNAIRHMSKNELRYYNKKIININQKTSPVEVQQILGRPSKVSEFFGVLTYRYTCQKFSLNCAIDISFANGTVSRVRWMDLQRFIYDQTFTDLDKVYSFGNYQLTLSLQPGWIEHIYSDDELKNNPNPPLTFVRSTNNNGNVDIYMKTISNKFDITSAREGLTKPEAGIKQYQMNGWTVYELDTREQDGTLRTLYLVKEPVIVFFFYQSPGGNVDTTQLQEAMDIAKTITVTKKTN